MHLLRCPPGNSSMAPAAAAVHPPTAATRAAQPHRGLTARAAAAARNPLVRLERAAEPLADADRYALVPWVPAAAVVEARPVLWQPAGLEMVREVALFTRGGCHACVQAYAQHPLVRLLFFLCRLFDWRAWYFPIFLAYLCFGKVLTLAAYVVQHPECLISVFFGVLDLPDAYLKFAGQRIWNQTVNEAFARLR